MGGVPTGLYEQAQEEGQPLLRSQTMELQVRARPTRNAELGGKGVGLLLIGLRHESFAARFFLGASNARAFEASHRSVNRLFHCQIRRL